MKTRLNTESNDDLYEPELPESSGDFEEGFLNFQEQVARDLDDVFFNVEAKEFVTPHTIAGFAGRPPAELNVIVDNELYKERVMRINDGAENITYNGIIFYIKKDDWIEAFKKVPLAEETLSFDGKKYMVEAVDDDMGTLEITLTGARGW